MERKEQEQYALLLMKRMSDMINENIRERGVLKQIKYKMQNDSNYRRTAEENDIYWRDGLKHSKSAIKRVRIELNEILKQMEKGYDNN